MTRSRITCAVGLVFLLVSSASAQLTVQTKTHLGGKVEDAEVEKTTSLGSGMVFPGVPAVLNTGSGRITVTLTGYLVKNKQRVCSGSVRACVEARAVRRTTAASEVSRACRPPMTGCSCRCRVAGHG